jgi:hypothetical protein
MLAVMSANIGGAMHTAMRSFGRPEDSRLSWLPHIGSYGLSRKQQRVCVGVGIIVYDPGQEADDGEGDEGAEDVPAGEYFADVLVKLL